MYTWTFRHIDPCRDGDWAKSPSRIEAHGSYTLAHHAALSVSLGGWWRMRMQGDQHNFDSQLHALTDDARRAEAIQQRRQRSNRAMSAALSGTFLGTLTELAETGSVVTVLTRTGATIRGQIAAVGPDIVVVHAAERARTLIRLAAIEGLREPGVGHNRTVESISGGPELAHILDGYVGEHTRMAFTLSTGNKFMGRIDRVGLDQLVITLDGGGEAMTIPLAVVDQVVISA